MGWVGVVLVLTAHGVLRSPVGSGGCGQATSLKPGQPTPQELALPSGTRTYHVTLPKGYAPGTAYPVVLGFHGWGLSAQDLLQYDGAVAEARKGRVIAVHPDGAQDVPEGRSRWRAWNAVGSSMASGASDATCFGVREDEYACYTSCGQCSRCSWASCQDDVAFVEALLDRLEAELCVDPHQVYGHGESNGGMMIWQLLQSHAAPRFAALVSVIGAPQLGAQRSPTAPVRFLGLWGGADKTIPPGGGASWDGFYYESADNATAAVAAALGCGAQVPWPSGLPGVRCHAFACAPPAEVVHCTFDGHHDWPKQATPLVFRFYAGRRPNLRK